MNPASYLASALEANEDHSLDQRLGAEVARTLFRSKDIILFPRAGQGQV